MSTARQTEDGPARWSVTCRGRVLPNWLDANGHMNVSWYDRLFDTAETTFFEEFGIHDDYIRRTGLSIFRLERVIVYEREMMLDDPLEARSRVLWTDLRRIHHFHELWNIQGNFRAAICDAVSIHVDLGTRKSVEAILPEVREPLLARRVAQGGEPFPPGVPRRVNGRRV